MRLTINYDLVKKYCIIASIICLISFLVSCEQPSAFYGKWADSKGDTITFYKDSFKASISNNIKEGKYTVLLNSIVLTLSPSDNNRQIASEWDIRGNKLYINWIRDDGTSIPLTLYKVSK